MFYKHFLDVLMAVTLKLVDSRWWRLNSVAEELALNAVLVRAKSLADEGRKTLDIAELYDIMFDDADFEWLLDPRFDGMEDDPAVASTMAPAFLHFDEWFKPFACLERPGVVMADSEDD